MTPEETFAQMVTEGDSVLGGPTTAPARVPDKVFIHYGEDGVKLTFAEFKQRTDRIAAGLVAMGATKGVAVSVLTRNSPSAGDVRDLACGRHLRAGQFQFPRSVIVLSA